MAAGGTPCGFCVALLRASFGCEATSDVTEFSTWCSLEASRSRTAQAKDVT
jgi:hypothetical protein